ncbi:MAG: OmpA family protein [Saprospiraceae bacterium]
MKHLLPVLVLLSGTLSAQSLFDSAYTVQQAPVYFDFGKSDITPQAGETLDALVTALRTTAGGLRIQITAHTDSIGNSENNLRLSRRRAEAVRDALRSRGLSEAQIFIRAAGEREPLADNSTEEGRQQNRRATLEVQVEVPMTTLEGVVRNPDTKEGIPNALVMFRTQSRADSTRTDTTGTYRVRLPKDSVVKVEALAPDYFFQTITLRAFGDPELYKKYNLSTDLELPPAVEGGKAVVRDLFFVGNQAILLPMSEPSLPKVLRFMQMNPDINIEIAGHINHPGLAPEKLNNWEWDLSINRAKMVYEYLIKNGVSEARMQYKGYGNTEMLFPNLGATEAEQQQNRRVEIRVLKKN